MLRFLGVRHLAVIDQLEVEFEPGLNILTGETGAGKSVLIEAIALLAGGRASADLVRTGEDVATIQAVFERPDGTEVIVRREISAQGRGRSFIDDSLATSLALKELGASLIDLYGQHEHHTLLDSSEHLAHVDARLSDGGQVEAVAAAFRRWRSASAALGRSQLDDREKNARIEIATFHLHEIRNIAPQLDEDTSLQSERSMLANVDRLSRLTNEAYVGLYEGEASALTALAGVWKRLGDLAALDGRFTPYLNDRASVKSSLEDLAFFLRTYATNLEASPQRLQEVEDRLAALERLRRKHGPTLADVVARQRALEEELAALSAGEERIELLSREEQGGRAGFLSAARALSQSRSLAGSALAQELQQALHTLAMPDARVDLRINPAPGDESFWSESGIDRVDFLLSANPGEDLRPLSRIASGGELSRIMLALRTLAATGQAGRTLVFDEVDAGIGGAAADAVGARLQLLAERYQVLCITHLPQVAARRGTHFHLSKQVAHGRTTTGITRLDSKGRELEIARMIAGAAISDGVLGSARELLLTRQGESEAHSKGEGESRRRAKAKGHHGA
ncbi:MAG: DNA repair protein RecN [Vicinamibacterales bacterium]